VPGVVWPASGRPGKGVGGKKKENKKEGGKKKIREMAGQMIKKRKSGINKKIID